MENLKIKYNELYSTLTHLKDAENMRLFGSVMSEYFFDTAASHPEAAENAIKSLEGVYYNNFLTEREAKKIIDGFVNADGTQGGKWSFNEIKQLCENKGLVYCEDGEFNFYALATVMNMIYSDSAPVLSQMLGDNSKDLAFWMYRLSYLRLHDADRPRWIRKYFNL
mgnify:CR=1 FL=1